MPRTCTVCTHPQKAEIDRALVDGTPFRHIAARFGTSTTALQRHKADHLPGALVKAAEAAGVADAGALLSQALELQRRVMRLLGLAEKAGDIRTALVAVGQARGGLELLGKLHETGDLEQRLSALESALEASLTARPQERGIRRWRV